MKNLNVFFNLKIRKLQKKKDFFFLFSFTKTVQLQAIMHLGQGRLGGLRLRCDSIVHKNNFFLK